MCSSVAFHAIFPSPRGSNDATETLRGNSFFFTFTIARHTRERSEYFHLKLSLFCGILNSSSTHKWRNDPCAMNKKSRASLKVEVIRLRSCWSRALAFPLKSLTSFRRNFLFQPFSPFSHFVHLEGSLRYQNLMLLYAFIWKTILRFSRRSVRIQLLGLSSLRASKIAACVLW